MIAAVLPLVVWPAALMALALAFTYSNGSAIWGPLVSDGAEVGLVIGLVHVAVVRWLRRAADRRRQHDRGDYDR
jgi:hypothetical protein